MLSAAGTLQVGGRLTDFGQRPRRRIFELGFESRRGVYQAEEMVVRGGQFTIFVPIKSIAKVSSDSSVS